MFSRVFGEKYRIVRSIGSGGMGVVYEAEQIETGQSVALKVIHANLAAQDDDVELVTRFELETRAAGSIASPHIARVLDAGVDPDSGRPFMVMEFLEGEDAQHLFGRVGMVTPDLALRIVAQACEGLRKAHEARIIHRDIKPANLFVARGAGDERIIKLLDFGVAKVLRDSESSLQNDGLTQTGTMLGSPLYMAPEQARSAKLVDHRSDLWSLGMVLYRALSGRTPYQHIRGLGDLVLALCSELPPLVQYFAPWVSPQVTAIVDRALRIDPDQRFQSAAEMLEAIRALLPGGDQITAGMIVPMTAEDREKTAPHYVRPARNVTGTFGPISVHAPVHLDPSTFDPNISRTPLPLSTQSGVGMGVEPSLPSVAPPRSGSIQTAAIVVLSIALGGVGVYALTRPTPEPTVAPSLVDSSGAAATPAMAPSVAPTFMVVPHGGASPGGALPPNVPLRTSPGRVDWGSGRGSAAAGSTDKTRPADSGKPKEPLRLDHTNFGDRK